MRKAKNKGFMNRGLILAFVSNGPFKLGTNKLPSKLLPLPSDKGFDSGFAGEVP